MDRFRFDAAKHIEPDFFGEVLRDVPNAWAFGEAIASDSGGFPQIDALDFYDSPLVATMRRAFGFGGNLRDLKNA